MGYAKWLITALFAIHAIATNAIADERSNGRDPVAVTDPQTHVDRSKPKAAGRAVVPLDRVASAVDGAESSHGQDVTMWRVDPSGPQGPMQVTEAAATDVGGGDRFDLLQNRAIGRAYLQQLYWRYGNWPDAIAAYNWGMGNMDGWVKAGRPPEKFLVGVGVYLRRVLHESGLCDGAPTEQSRQPSEGAKAPAQARPDTLAHAACSVSDGWAGLSVFGSGPIRFSRKLNQALQLALQRASQSR
jgi:hypothetical protein